MHSGAPSVPTEATPPGCLDVAACCHGLWCPFPVGLPVPLRCHLLVIVSQVIAGANCPASLVGTAGAIGAIVDARLPPVRLPSLAHAAGPPDLPVALGCDDPAAQVSVGSMVPLLLQVRSQPADVWARLLSTRACNKASVVLLCRGKERSLTTVLLHQAGCTALSTILLSF